jgi:hypothetical protein
MVDRDLSKGKEQNVKDLVEEEVEMIPCKTKKRRGRIWLGQIKSQPGKRSLPLCEGVGKN